VKDKIVHYVYYLYSASGELVEVGRSIDPSKRRRLKEKKHEIQLRLQLSEPLSFDAARKRERSEIALLRPKFNKKIASGRGNFGQTMPEHVRKKISVSIRKPDVLARVIAASKGRICKPETRLKLSIASKGRVVSFETRAAISAAKLGVPLSAEHRAAARLGMYTPEAQERLKNAMVGNVNGRGGKGKVLSARDKARVSEGMKRYHADVRLLQFEDYMGELHTPLKKVRIAA
jgi:hypothetical protein